MQLLSRCVIRLQCLRATVRLAAMSPHANSDAGGAVRLRAVCTPTFKPTALQVSTRLGATHRSRMNPTVERKSSARTFLARLMAGALAYIACSCAAAPDATVLHDAPAYTMSAGSTCAAAEQRRVFSGMNTTCMRAGAQDQLFCWGANLDGTLSVSQPEQLKDCRLEGTKGPVPCSRRPVAVGLEHVRDVALGSTNCALDVNGGVTCWGLRGALMGDTIDSRVELPWRMNVEQLKGVKHIVTWQARVFGVRLDGAVECLDLSDLSAPKACSPSLNPFATLDQPVRQLETSQLSACALTQDGRVFCADLVGPGPDCWAGGCIGPLREVSKLRAQSIGLNLYGACALDANGRVWCWGADGDPGGPSAAAPQRLADLPRIQSLVGGAGHGCATTIEGDVYCWGADSAEARAAARGKHRPELVQGVSSPCELAGGIFHMCAATADNEVVCWGGNHYGQLGDGSGAARRNRAAPVLAPAADDGNQHSEDVPR